MSFEIALVEALLPVPVPQHGLPLVEKFGGKGAVEHYQVEGRGKIH